MSLTDDKSRVDDPPTPPVAAEDPLGSAEPPDPDKVPVTESPDAPSGEADDKALPHFASPLQSPITLLHETARDCHDTMGSAQYAASDNTGRASADESRTPDISTLRSQLNAATSAKAAAETRVDVLEAELSRFKDQHAFVAAAKEAVEAQLREEVRKREAAEEKVELLRGQVEAARRSVMTLQKQDQDRATRRASHNPPEEDDLTGKQAKRASMYGLGRSVRPQSMQSNPSDETASSPVVPTGGLRELRLGSSAARTSRPASTGLKPATSTDFPRSPRKAPLLPRSPHTPRVDATDKDSEGSASSASSPTTSSPQQLASQERRASLSAGSTASTADKETAEQLKSARIESAALRAQIEALTAKLAEADDARLASEDCLRALREFLVAQPQDGAHEQVSLPPLPTETEDEVTPVAPVPSKWGFNMWRRESVSQTDRPAPLSEAWASPEIAVSPPTHSEPLRHRSDSKASTKTQSTTSDKEEPKGLGLGFLSGWSKPAEPAPVPSPVPEETEPTPPEGANLGRSLTSFFGRRARMTSRAAERAQAEKEAAEAAVKELQEDAPDALAIAAAAANEESDRVDTESRRKALPPVITKVQEDDEELAEMAKTLSAIKSEVKATEAATVAPKAEVSGEPETLLAYLDEDTSTLPPPKPERAARRAQTVDSRSPSGALAPTSPLVSRSQTSSPRPSSSPRLISSPVLSRSPLPGRSASLSPMSSPVLSSSASMERSPSAMSSNIATPYLESEMMIGVADDDAVEEVADEPEAKGDKPVRPARAPQRSNARRDSSSRLARPVRKQPVPSSPVLASPGRGGFV